ncbi:hypothetical protein [Nocardioides euryhalodurans]|uniref:DUF4268 domain-containing protein n=1 Tax=Nocardioides euryhalodurans TaxID=2518370 RepID=A0A4V1BE39_9ACTN|nr:hypothetical protein [Nocardioides euryhalodurans]QBR93282.1 hypothetical protein EXE57_14180 [Nocardioides euryhalodurans]
MTMAKLMFGKLSEAWKGEATDFTPLLADQLDNLGDALGIDLAAVGKSEVLTTGGRRIDIVAQGEDGSEFVIENQYGRADHDHLTRGLAYAVARHARGLVVVAEEHRDEFKAVAQYLNDMAELDQDRGISVWLVEAKAVRIGESPWAPLFTAVVEPNAFTANVEQAKMAEKPGSLEEFYGQFAVPDARAAAEAVMTAWLGAGYRRRIESNHVVLEAAGPATSGIRTVIAIFNDGRIFVPFSSYAGVNSGIEIPALVTPAFREDADSLFAFNGTEKQARTQPGWLSSDRVEPLLAFCFGVANAYKEALSSSV